MYPPCSSRALPHSYTQIFSFQGTIPEGDSVYKHTPLSPLFSRPNIISLCNATKTQTQDEKEAILADLNARREEAVRLTAEMKLICANEAAIRAREKACASSSSSSSPPM